jgi:hypothetical protein
MRVAGVRSVEACLSGRASGRNWRSRLRQLLHTLGPTERDCAFLAASDIVIFKSILLNVFVCLRHRSLINPAVEEKSKAVAA